jgi:hypothetical protein
LPIKKEPQQSPTDLSSKLVSRYSGRAISQAHEAWTQQPLEA